MVSPRVVRRILPGMTAHQPSMNVLSNNKSVPHHIRNCLTRPVDGDVCRMVCSNVKPLYVKGASSVGKMMVLSILLLRVNQFAKCIFIFSEKIQVVLDPLLKEKLIIFFWSSSGMTLRSLFQFHGRFGNSNNTLIDIVGFDEIAS